MNAARLSETILAAMDAHPLVERLVFASVELAVLAILVALAIACLRIRSPRACAMLWLIVLAKPIVTLAFGAVFPVLRLAPPAPILAEAALPAFTPVERDSAYTVSTDAVGRAPEAEWPTPASTDTPVAPAAPVRRAVDWGALATRVPASLWLGGVVFLTLLTVIDRIRLRRLLARTSTPSEHAATALARGVASLQLPATPPLRVTAELESPAVVGWFRSAIVIPRWLDGPENTTALAWALRHELTHLKHRDPAANALRRLAQILFFFHPVTWWASRRWEAAVELACDRAVVQTDDDVTAYAEQLYEILVQARQQRRSAMATGLFATRTQINTRIAALLGDSLRTPARLGIATAMTLTLFAGAVFAVGGAIGDREEAGGAESASDPDADALAQLLPQDAALQAACESLLEGKEGAIVVLNADTGAVLAMASVPHGTMEEVVASDSARQAQPDLLQVRPPYLRAYREQYPPGSLFKIVLAAAALEEGVIDVNTTYYCGGSFRINGAGRDWRCWNRAGHGRVNVTDALAHSCDVFFYNVGLNLGVDKITTWAAMFGLGELTGIDLPKEIAGLIPNQEWKKQINAGNHASEQKWYPGDTVNLSIGQGMTATTPLQNAVMTAAIANGGYRVTPRMNPALPVERGERMLGDATLEILQAGLRKAMEKAPPDYPTGTGWRAGVEGIEVIGKTGSAQVMSLQAHEKYGSEDDIPYAMRDHAWFVAGVMDREPRIAVCVLLEHRMHGSLAAAEIARAVIAQVYGIPPSVGADAVGRPAASSRRFLLEKASPRQGQERPYLVRFNSGQSQSANLVEERESYYILTYGKYNFQVRKDLVREVVKLGENEAGDTATGHIDTAQLDESETVGHTDLVMEQFPARRLTFPEDRSRGTVWTGGPMEYEYEIDRQSDIRVQGGWEKLGEARGDIEIPAGRYVRLDVGPRGERVDLSPLAKLPADGVQYLDLSALEFGEDGLRHIAGLTGLEALKLSLAKIKDADLNHLAGLSNLRWLSLSSATLEGRDFSPLAGLQKLIFLDLYSVSISTGAAAQIGQLPQLETLALRFTNVTGDHLEAISGMPRLKSLDLDFCPIANEDLKHLHGLKTLTQLGLERTRIAPGYKEILAALPNLVTADVNFNAVPEARNHVVLIGGKVTNENGEMIEGVQVEFFGQYPDEPAIGSVDRGKSDANGRWEIRLADGWTRLSARLSHPDYISGETPVPPDGQLRNKSATFVMNGGTKFSGTVLDNAGSPVAGAYIIPNPFSGKFEDLAAETGVTLTDAQGRFTTVTLDKRRHLHLTVSSPEHAAEVVPLDYRAPEKPIAVTLGPGSSISGIVADASGAPLAQAKLSVTDWITDGPHPAPRETFTDSSGRFQMDHVPEEGVLSLEVAKYGYYQASLQESLPVLEPLTLALIKEQPFRGRVLDASTGKPVAEYNVEIGTLSESGEYSWLHIAKGQIEFNRESGTFSSPLYGVFRAAGKTSFVAHVLAKGYTAIDTEPLDAARLGEEVEIRMVSAPAVEGIVRSSDGKPAAGARIAWARKGDLAFLKDGVLLEGLTDGPDWFVTSGVDGRFFFGEATGPGLLLATHAGGFAWLDLAGLDSTPELTLAPWVRVEGTLQVPNRSNRRIYVELRAPAPLGGDRSVRIVIDEVRTDEAGRFVLEKLPAMPMTIGTSTRAEDFHKLVLDPRPGEVIRADIGGAGALSSSLPARPLPFPEDRSLGTLYLADPIDYDITPQDLSHMDGWEEIGEARGRVEIPAGKIVRLDVGPPGVGEQFAALPANGIQHLNLSMDRNSESELRYISGLTGLLALSFSREEISDTELRYLRPLVNLRWLDLFGLKLETRDLTPLLALKQLRHLGLAGVDMAGATEEVSDTVKPGQLEPIACVGKLTQLRSLDLSGSGVTGAHLRELVNLTELVALKLDGCPVVNEDLRMLSTLKNLHSLSLRVTRIADGYGEHLAALRNLVSLDVDYTDTTDAEHRQVTLGGRIVTEDNQPAPGVRVALTGEYDDSEVRRGDMGISDADGRWQVRMPLGWTRLTASLSSVDYVSDRMPSTRVVPPDDQLRDQSAVFTVRIGTSVSGTVRDSAGNPVPDAIILDRPQIPFELIRDIRTDETGKFLVDHVDESQDLVLTVHSDRYAPEAVVVARAELAAPILVTLDAGAVLRGEVRDPLDEPIAGVTVTIEGWRPETESSTQRNLPDAFHPLQQETHTDAGGSFSFPRVPANGGIQLSFSHDKYLSAYMHAKPPFNEPLQANLVPDQPFRGRVVDAHSGNPVSDFEIEFGLRFEGGDFGWGQAGMGEVTRGTDDGEFTVHLNQGLMANLKFEFGVRVTAKGYDVAVSNPIDGTRLGELITIPLYTTNSSENAPPTVVEEPAPDLFLARTLAFPEDRSLGTLYLADPVDFDTAPDHVLLMYMLDSWEKLGEARGRVEIPEGKIVRLSAKVAWTDEAFAALPAGCIQHLTLSPDAPSQAGMPRHAVWGGLLGLGYYGQAFPDAELPYLEGLENLRWLDLRGARLGSRDLDVLSTLVQLRCLNLADADLSGAGPAPLKGFANLERLQLLDLSRSGVAGADLRELSSLRDLVSLNLDKCPVVNEDLDALAALENLERLSLERTGITDGYKERLSTLKNLTSPNVDYTDTSDAEHRATALGGRVLAEDGKPAPGVYVTLGTDGPDYFSSVRSGADGRWQALVQIGWTLAAVQLAGGGYVNEVAPTILTETDVARLRASTLESIARPGASLSGVVLDPAGKPVAGARIRRDNREMPREQFHEGVRTDAEGRFTIGRLDDSQELALAVLSDRHAPFALHVPAGPEKALVTVTLSDGMDFHGEVRDANEEPVEGVVITASSWRPGTDYAPSQDKERPRLSHSHRLFQEARSDAEGKFTLTNLPDYGKVQFSLRKADYYPASLSAEPPYYDDAVVYVVPYTPFRGRVVDAATGEPVPDYGIVLDMRTGGRGFNWPGRGQPKAIRDAATGEFSAHLNLTTDAATRTEFAARITAEGYKQATSKVVSDAQLGEIVTIELQPEPTDAAAGD